MDGKAGDQTNLGHGSISKPYKHFVQDTLKGSYYANIKYDDPSPVGDNEQATFPEYYGTNICEFCSVLALPSAKLSLIRAGRLHT